MEQEKDVSCAVFSDGVGRAFAPEQIEHYQVGLSTKSTKYLLFKTFLTIVNVFVCFSRVYSRKVNLFS